MAEFLIEKIQGFLFDLNGVLHIENSLIPGADKTIQCLKEKNIPYRFLTNTSTKSTETLYRKLNSMGLSVEKSDIFSSPRATLAYLKKLGKPRCLLVLAEDVKKDFEEFPTSDVAPDFIVIGDIGEAWNYALLNKIFRMVMSGAQIIALHKDKYWQVEDGLKMDIGAFVTGLEYSTGKQAIIMGKPSLSYFNMAIQDIGLKSEEIAMVGDDIEIDIGGAKRAGLKTILVKTGKYRESLVASSGILPDLILPCAADIFR
ncbi:MAG: TIGR01458 family HAD-type hydrolase [Candidatus Brocadiae bacterium]|nr:TIGR01458 family HAD-type hydrolase [Candidatus Brocadiia bacterium]